MAVLVEGISVLVRKDAIENKMQGGWKRFLLTVPNSTLCHDDELARVGFMEPATTREFMEELESMGLTYIEEGKPVDMLVCDQQSGPLADCEWIQFARFPIEGGKVGMAWLWLGSRRGFGVHMPAKGLKLHTPPGWVYEGSLSDKFTFVPESQLSNRTDH